MISLQLRVVELLHCKKNGNLSSKRKILKNRYTRLNVNVKYFSKNPILHMNGLKSTAISSLSSSKYQQQVTQQRI